ncbi:hypothetical protein KVK84_00635 [Helicobacter pylori]|nr:hypothetical protein KVK84_00635 [Helicobacter pylori]
MLLYEMRWNVLKLFYHGSIRHYVSKIFAQQNLKLTAKKPKSLKSKDFKKAVVFKKIALNTRIE